MATTHEGTADRSQELQQDADHDEDESDRDEDRELIWTTSERATARRKIARRGSTALRTVLGASPCATNWSTRSCAATRSTAESRSFRSEEHTSELQSHSDL